MHIAMRAAAFDIPISRMRRARIRETNHTASHAHLQDADDEEVEVGETRELLEEEARQEVRGRVLGCLRRTRARPREAAAFNSAGPRGRARASTRHTRPERARATLTMTTLSQNPCSAFPAALCAKHLRVLSRPSPPASTVDSSRMRPSTESGGSDAGPRSGVTMAGDASRSWAVRAAMTAAPRVRALCLSLALARSFARHTTHDQGWAPQAKYFFT